MKRNPMLRWAACLLLLLLVLLAAGGPNQAGALAGVGGSGAGAAVGLAWIVVFPAVVLMVPPLLFAAIAEGVHGFESRAHPPTPRGGLGSRSASRRHSPQ